MVSFSDMGIGLGGTPLVASWLHGRVWFNSYWNTVDVSPLNTIAILFGTWPNGVEPKIADHIRVGACAILWVI